jgi:hypothetical protein
MYSEYRKHKEGGPIKRMMTERMNRKNREESYKKDQAMKYDSYKKDQKEWMDKKDKKMEDTPFMFYWTGFEEMGLPPLPVWYFIGDDYCKFSIGE